MQAEQKQRRNRRLPREVRERQILTAAVDVFAARGFHAASMDEISEVAGISKPMIYAYLGAKEELFEACIRKEAERPSRPSEIVVRVNPEQQLWQGYGFFVRQRQPRRWLILPPQAAGAVHQRIPYGGGAPPAIAELLARHREVPAAAQRADAAVRRGAGRRESLVEWWFDSWHPRRAGPRLMNMVWMGFEPMRGPGHGQVIPPAPGRSAERRKGFSACCGRKSPSC